jgi:hypothetical protein
MLTAAGNINQQYRVIGVVHAFISRPQTDSGCGRPGGLPIREAYEDVTAALVEATAKSGGDALIHISYDYRMSVAKFGCNDTKPVFEVYGWGTAVKLQ